MKGLKRIKVTDTTTDSTALYEIDFDHPKLIWVMKEVNEFWSGSKERLAEYDGEIVPAFLSFLTKEIFMISISGRWYKERIIREFEDKEGFMSLDGSYGIKLLSVDIFNEEWMGIKIEDTEDGSELWDN